MFSKKPKYCDIIEITCESTTWFWRGRFWTCLTWSCSFRFRVFDWHCAWLTSSRQVVGYHSRSALSLRHLSHLSVIRFDRRHMYCRSHSLLGLTGDWGFRTRTLQEAIWCRSISDPPSPWLWRRKSIDTCWYPKMEGSFTLALVQPDIALCLFSALKSFVGYWTPDGLWYSQLEMTTFRNSPYLLLLHACLFLAAIRKYGLQVANCGTLSWPFPVRSCLKEHL